MILSPLENPVRITEVEIPLINNINIPWLVEDNTQSACMGGGEGEERAVPRTQPWMTTFAYISISSLSSGSTNTLCQMYLKTDLNIGRDLCAHYLHPSRTLYRLFTDTYLIYSFVYIIFYIYPPANIILTVKSLMKGSWIVYEYFMIVKPHNLWNSNAPSYYLWFWMR